VVQFEGIEMIPYLHTLADHRNELGRRPLLVFDDHNAEYVLQRRFFEMDLRVPSRWLLALYSLVQWQKLKRYEAWACRHVDAVVAVSSEDAAALQRIVPGLGVTVVPNGVDVSRYASFSGPKAALVPQNLVFTGTMDFRPNVDAVVWFCHDVLPRVRQREPSVRFYIVGRRPHPRVAALQDLPGVEVTGAVPDQMPYIGAATVFVIPMRGGGGTRLKVLEAMAMRRAIVSTSMGCSGFPVAHGCEVVLADDAAGFAREVVELLQNADRREALGGAALAFARRYDWPEIVPRFEAVYERKTTP
jgi:glycosyltransferase involved in cell wall biosynthesis